MKLSKKQLVANERMLDTIARENYICGIETLCDMIDNPNEYTSAEIQAEWKGYLTSLKKVKAAAAKIQLR